MFLDTTTEQRITHWREFRENLTQSTTPLQDIVDLWKTAPVTERNLDPWSSQRWPTPWELLEERFKCKNFYREKKCRRFTKIRIFFI